MLIEVSAHQFPQPSKGLQFHEKALFPSSHGRILMALTESGGYVPVETFNNVGPSRYTRMICFSKLCVVTFQQWMLDSAVPLDLILPRAFLGWAGCACWWLNEIRP